MQIEPKEIKIVSEPWYRGSSLVNQACLFTIILFSIDWIENDTEGIEWSRNFMPLITVLLLMLVSQRKLIDKEKR